MRTQERYRNRATAYPSAADMLRQLRPIHAQCQNRKWSLIGKLLGDCHLNPGSPCYFFPGRGSGCLSYVIVNLLIAAAGARCSKPFFHYRLRIVLALTDE